MELRKAIRLLSPLMVEGVLSVRNYSQHRLVEMLHELQFITRSVVTTNNHIIIKLQILDAELFYRLLSGEANKFLLASRVSYERSIQDQLDNASWQAIENYYSAYYGVHYLLRLTGISLTNLDARGTNSIMRSAYGAPQASSIPGGLYVMEYDDSSSILTLTKNIQKSGGSHQDAWRLWGELVDRLCEQATTDPVEYTGISIDLAEHKRFLTRSGAKFNPPEIRGEINYQFRGGSWVFEKNAERSIRALQKLITSAHPLTSSTALTPEGLIANNRIIIFLAKAVFMHVSERYPRSICRSLSHKYASYIS